MIRFDLHKDFTSKGKSIKIRLKAKSKQGQIIAIYGKSGVGKSTLLRMLAGLTKPDKGFISVDETYWFNSSKNINIKVNKRPIGFIFQDYSLFPNMTVLKNIEYGLEKQYDYDYVKRIIDITNINDFLEQKPNTLSGGQQQRVAFARAIIRKPKLLLLDEPLSALDMEMRQMLQDEILAIKMIINTTIIFVSHNLPEVFKLADKVMVIEEGEFIKKGSPSSIFIGDNTETHLYGEILSVNKNKGQKTLSILIDGKVVAVNLKRNISR